MIDWGAPAWVSVAAAVLVLLSLAFALDRTRRRKLHLRLGAPALVLRLTASLSPRRRAVRAVLVVVGVTLAVLALARPRVVGEETWRQRGIDVALVVDFSRSMSVGDVEPRDRIGRARLEVDRVLAALTGERVAVVAFAGSALSVPLTTDHEAVRLLLDGLVPGDLAPGTGIAGAVQAARCLLARGAAAEVVCPRVGVRDPRGLEEPAALAAQPVRGEGDEGERARALVLFTDGEETSGHAAAELARAAQDGIEVFVVGIGTDSGGPIPERDEAGEPRGWVHDEHGQPVTARLARASLVELTRAAGRPERLVVLDAERGGLPGVLEELGTLAVGERAWRVVRAPRDVSHWFLFPALLALVFEACLSERRRGARAEAPR